MSPFCPKQSSKRPCQTVASKIDTTTPHHEIDWQYSFGRYENAYKN